MNQINFSDVEKYIKDNIGDFHIRRAESMRNLELRKIIARKNPYLYRAKNVALAQDFVKIVLNAYLSSQEETIFGEFLEGLARYVAKLSCGGIKSSTEGIDLEFEREEKRYLVSIKSGPNWGNSSQVKKMVESFQSAIKILKTGNPNIEVVCINGCCYGRSRDLYRKQGYYKYCGERFWTFLTNHPELYKKIVEPLSHKAKERGREFNKQYNKMVNIFTKEFMEDFCRDGEIDWGRLVDQNSAIKKPLLPQRKN